MGRRIATGAINNTTTITITGQLLLRLLVLLLSLIASFCTARFTKVPICLSRVICICVSLRFTLLLP
jgi:hypothetical protein